MERTEGANCSSVHIILYVLYNRIKVSEPHIFEQSQAVAIPFLPERTNRPHNIIFKRKIQNFYFPEQTNKKLFSCRHWQSSNKQLIGQAHGRQTNKDQPKADKLGNTVNWTN
jgi:hypothetical protein